MPDRYRGRVLTVPKVPKLCSALVEAKIAEQSVDEIAIPARSVSMLKSTVIASPDCSKAASVIWGEAQKVKSVNAKTSGSCLIFTARDVPTDVPL